MSAGKDDEQIRSHLLDYPRHYSLDAAEPGDFMFEPSGYIDYYRNRRLQVLGDSPPQIAS